MAFIISHVFHGKDLSLHIKCSLSHALLYSFIVFKYVILILNVILILRKDKYMLGRIGLYFGGFGEKLNYF